MVLSTIALSPSGPSSSPISFAAAAAAALAALARTSSIAWRSAAAIFSSAMRERRSINEAVSAFACSTVAVVCSAMDRRLHCLGGPILGDGDARQFGNEILRQLRCHRLDFLHRSVTCFADAVLCRLGLGADFDVGRLDARLGLAQRF